MVLHCSPCCPFWVGSVCYSSVFVKVCIHPFSRTLLISVNHLNLPLKDKIFNWLFVGYVTSRYPTFMSKAFSREVNEVCQNARTLLRKRGQLTTAKSLCATSDAPRGRL